MCLIRFQTQHVQDLSHISQPVKKEETYFCVTHGRQLLCHINNCKDVERLTFCTSCTKAFVIDIEKWLNIYFLLLPAYVVISLDRTRKRYIFRIWNSLIYNLDTFVNFIYMEVIVTKLVVSRANELTKNLIHSTFTVFQQC